MRCPRRRAWPHCRGPTLRVLTNLPARSVSPYVTDTTLPETAANGAPATAAAPSQGTERLALGAALVTVTLWASAFVGIRSAGRAIGAGPLSLGRLVVAGAVLGAIVAVRREALLPRADLPRLVLFALLWFGAYNVITQRRRAPGRCRHGGDAREHRSRVHRAARRRPPPRGLPADAARRRRGRVRRRDRHRRGDVRARRAGRMGRGAVHRGGTRLRRWRRRPEAAARADLRPSGHVPRLRRRRDRVPAIRTGV